MPPPITPRKRLGQNFLRDPNTARKIVASLEAPPGAPVVEIGPGTGALTAFLLAEHPGMTAIEVDERAVRYLREHFPALDVRQEDVLATDWRRLAGEKGGPLSVVGNLPYYITSQILFSLLQAGPYIRRAVVMMQLEVAERLVASPGTKAYGILSVQTQLFTRPHLLFRVSRNVFYPRPDVTSAVVRLDPLPEPPAVDPEKLRGVVRTAFNQRRKTLRNSLRSWTDARGVELPPRWADLRAEALSPADFVELARFLGGEDQGGKV